MLRKLNPQNRYEKGLEILFHKFEMESDLNESIELLKNLNKRKKRYDSEVGSMFARYLKGNIRHICEMRIRRTFNYLKNEFPKLKKDGYVNERYINAAEILEWLNTFANEEGIQLYRLLRKEKIIDSEGEYRIMLYKIYDRSGRAELINSAKLINSIVKKENEEGKSYERVLKSLIKSEYYARKAGSLKHSDIGWDVKKQIVAMYDKSAKEVYKKLSGYNKEYDLSTYEGFCKVKNDLGIVEFCRARIEDLTKKAYKTGDIKSIKKAIISKWLSPAAGYGNEIDKLRNKLLNLRENYEDTYEGVTSVEDDFEKLNLLKNDIELFSEEEYPLKTEEISEEIKKHKLRAAPQYDKAAREIYAKLSKYSEEYNLNTPGGRRNARAELMKLEKNKAIIERLTGKEYPIKGLEKLKERIEKKEGRAAVKREAAAAPRKKGVEYGFNQDDFMQGLLQKKFGIGVI